MNKLLRLTQNKKGFVPVVALIIIAAAVVVGVGASIYLATQLQQQPEQQTNQPTSRSMVVIRKGDKIVSVTVDGKSEIDLTSYGVTPSSLLVESRDRKILYFTRENEIWRVNTDGTELQKGPITTTSTICYTDLRAVSDDGNKLLYLYDSSEMGSECGESEGYRYYDFIKNEVEIFNVSSSYDLAGFYEDELLFSNIRDGRLYVLNVETGNIERKFDFQLPALSPPLFINQDSGYIIYNSSYIENSFPWQDICNTPGCSYSQIFLYDYKNDVRRELSPRGIFAEYQPPSVSPNFKNLIYTHQIRRTGPNPSEIEFYRYNLETSQLSKLPISQALSDFIKPFITLNPLAWLDDITFLLGSGEEISRGQAPRTYKFNIETAELTPFFQDDQETWQTYRNEKYGFEFKYPSNLTLLENSAFDNKGAKVPLVVLLPEGQDYTIHISLLRADSAAAPIEEEQKRHVGEKNYSDVDAGDFRGYKTQQGLTFMEGTQEIKKDGVTYQLLNKSNPQKWLRITVTASVGTVLTRVESYIINIISTFKITDTFGAEWKTHRNEKYGFELGYPSDWKLTDASFTKQGNEIPSVNIESPLRYDLSGYEGDPVSYRILIYRDSSGELVKIADFGSPAPKFGHQSDWNITINKNTKEATEEYKVGGRIISSFKFVQ